MVDLILRKNRLAGAAPLRQRGAATLCRPPLARRIVSQRLILLRPWLSLLGHTAKGGKVMRLLLVFLASLLVGQSISIGVGLLVERHATPYTGLVTFIAFYFAMFWVAWRFAVRVTAPRPHVRERGEPSAVLLGYAAADDLWSQSALLL